MTDEGVPFQLKPGAAASAVSSRRVGRRGSSCACSQALAEELRLVNLELRAGGDRSRALRNLASRTGVDEIDTINIYWAGLLAMRRAIEQLDTAGVLDTLRITHRAARGWALGQDGEGRPRLPRIAVAGLNPHAGEGGLFGDEEIRIIAPAIAAARAEGIDAQGPFAPDTVFMRARHAPPGHPGEFDVVVAMTHDHGLIPVKYLGVDEGVNVTLGLPFVRTSPDHGTAFDIAGTGRADPSSLLEAVRMARVLAR